MLELEIDGQVFQFKFGMGFLKEINKQVEVPVNGMPGVKNNVGLRWAITQMYDGDVEALLNVLFIANRDQNPRVTTALLESYVDDENTDIEGLFTQVLDFLKRTNATKKVTLAVMDQIEKAMAQEEERQKAMAQM